MQRIFGDSLHFHVVHAAKGPRVPAGPCFHRSALMVRVIPAEKRIVGIGRSRNGTLRTKLVLYIECAQYAHTHTYILIKMYVTITWDAQAGAHTAFLLVTTESQKSMLCMFSVVKQVQQVSLNVAKECPPKLICAKCRCFLGVHHPSVLQATRTSTRSQLRSKCDKR